MELDARLRCIIYIGGYHFPNSHRILTRTQKGGGEVAQHLYFPSKELLLLRRFLLRSCRHRHQTWNPLGINFTHSHQTFLKVLWQVDQKLCQSYIMFWHFKSKNICMKRYSVYSFKVGNNDFGKVSNATACKTVITFLCFISFSQNSIFLDIILLFLFKISLKLYNVL